LNKTSNIAPKVLVWVQDVLERRQKEDVIHKLVNCVKSPFSIYAAVTRDRLLILANKKTFYNDIYL
jgi:hypothetical protein